MVERSPKNLLQKEIRRLQSMAIFERRLRREGYKVIVGVDEAGRGPLAGPVVAAACSLPSKISLLVEGIDDSKKLSASKREEIFQQLTHRSDVVFGVGIVDSILIDSINILQATFVAMQQAISSLPLLPDFVLFDGNQTPSLEGIAYKGLIRGDERSVSIAAASIIAKQTRDHLMEEYHERWPMYGFHQHKGYGTEAHRRALQEHGPCEIHRFSFEPIKSWA